MATKIQASAIKLVRAEGRIDECMTVIVTATEAKDEHGNIIGRYIEGGDVWRRANAVLASWSHTAPRSGGYHKCDFIITYADGETYQGRYDLMNMSVDGYPSIEQHMFDHCSFSSGRAKPAHRTWEQWNAYLRDIVGAEGQASLARFLDTYAIGTLNETPGPRTGRGGVGTQPCGVCTPCMQCSPHDCWNPRPVQAAP